VLFGALLRLFIVAQTAPRWYRVCGVIVSLTTGDDIDDIKERIMYRTDGRGHLAVIMVMATLALLAVGAIGIEAAIQRRILAPPQLELRIGSVYIRANSSAPQPVPACPSRGPSPNDLNSLGACSQQFYVVLALIQTGTPDNKLWILQLLNLPIAGQRGPVVLLGRMVL
jgi:hypothetical protein